MSLRRILISLFMPIAWRLSKKQACVALQRFAVTEIDSAWQSLYAMKATNDPKIRAKLFQHAVEEIQHGALFNRVSKYYTDTIPSTPVPERIPLLKMDGGPGKLTSFYALEYLGEKAVRDEFDTYMAAAPFDKVKGLFMRAKDDERGHADYTNEVLSELSGSQWVRTWELTKAHAIRAYEAWCRFGKIIGELPPTILMSAIYYVFGLVVHASSRKKIETTWETERFSSQDSADTSDQQQRRAA